jgi:hypothetical protein
MPLQTQGLFEYGILHLPPPRLQTVLGPIIEHVREVDKSASELSGVARTLQNAFGLYIRTRPAASSESMKVCVCACVCVCTCMCVYLYVCLFAVRLHFDPVSRVPRALPSLLTW